MRDLPASIAALAEAIAPMSGAVGAVGQAVKAPEALVGWVEQVRAVLAQPGV